MTEADGVDAGETGRGAVGLVLPSSWWTIRLADVDARRRSIVQLVEQQVGRSDERAALRADLRRELEATAEQTAAAGGVLLAISTMTVGGTPVPASLAVYRVGRHALTEADARELADLLAAELTDAADGADDADGATDDGDDADSATDDAPTAPDPTGPEPAHREPPDRGATGVVPPVVGLAGEHGPVVRRMRLDRGSPELGAEDQPDFVVDYWLDAGDGTLTNLTFSTPMVALAAPLLDLFETVVSTLAVDADDAS